MKRFITIPVLLAALWLFSPCLLLAKTKLWGLADGIPHPTVTALAANQDWVWAGTGKGLVVKAATDNHFIQLPAATSRILALIAYGDEAWAATAEGLYRTNARTRAWNAISLPEAAGKEIRALQFGMKEMIWLGTETALFQGSKQESGWKKIPLPEGLAGPIQSIACSGSLCFIGSGSGTLAILDQETMRWLNHIPCPETLAVTALVVQGTTIWIGTNGGGLYIYDWAKNSWEHPSWSDAQNGFIHAAAVNGSAFWFGTFAGLLQSGTRGQLVPVNDPVIQQGCVNCLAVGPQELFAGTEFGIAALPLAQPALSVQPLQSVVLSAAEMAFTGQAFSSTPITKIKVSCALQALSQIWFTDNCEVQLPDGQGRFTGKWSLQGLPSLNDFYLLRVEATDSRGRTNAAIVPVLIAVNPPQIAFNPVAGTVNTGLQTLSGKFSTPFLATIMMEPGGVQPMLDVPQGTFAGTLNLVPGENAIRVRLLDWFKRETSAVLRVKAEEMVPEKVVKVEAGAKKGEETILLSEALLFDTASISIKASGFSALNKAAEYMNRDEDVHAIIIGHTDNIPINTRQFPNNRVLSLERAKAVFDYLVKNRGFVPERFDIKGQGEAQPIADNKTGSGRAKNRRVEILLKKETAP
ncbi:OmpA family protein [candidate division FCPU426 bacterium]|nr:OmpA family protein [candidate division FCPU426 bacterium]